MKIKRVVQGTALAALAAAAWMGAGSDASAADISAFVDNYSGDGYKLVIETDSDVEVAVGIASVSKGNAKVTAWDVYDSGSAIVDLSKLNVTKDNYFAVKTVDIDTPAFYKIPAAAKKSVVKYNAGTAKITTFTADGTDVLKEGFQYRTVTGNWTDGSDLSIADFQYQGATLYLRRNPVAPASDKKTEALNDITINKKNPIKVTATVLETLPTKEVKLNIAKQAKGPAVAVDYVKGTVKLKANTEYRFVNESGIGKAASNSAVAPAMAETFVTSGDKGVLEVRTAATTGDKSKCASKWTRVDIEKPAALAASTKVVNADCSAVTTEKAIDLVTSGGALTAKFSADKKTKAANGLELTNGTNVNIDYCFSSKEPSATDKFKVLKAKATKAVTIKSKDVKDNLYIRVSGVKADKKWAGKWTSYGKIEIK